MTMEDIFFEITDRANSVQKYDFFLKNMHAQTTLEMEVKNVLERKPVCRVLDIGCGEAQALKELKEKFGKKIFTTGIDFLDAEGIDEFIKGKAQEVSFPKNIDLVFSFRAMHEFSPIEKVVEKTCKCLALKGKAFLSIRCQQMVGGRLLFHGNMHKKDFDFLKKIINAKDFKGARVKAVEVKEKKQVLLSNPQTGSKMDAELEIIHGINLFIEKK